MICDVLGFEKESYETSLFARCIRKKVKSDDLIFLTSLLIVTHHLLPIQFEYSLTVNQINSFSLPHLSVTLQLRMSTTTSDNIRLIFSMNIERHMSCCETCLSNWDAKVSYVWNYQITSGLRSSLLFFDKPFCPMPTREKIKLQWIRKNNSHFTLSLLLFHFIVISNEFFRLLSSSIVELIDLSFFRLSFPLILDQFILDEYQTYRIYFIHKRK